MFRKNYVPKLTIHVDSRSGKYIAIGECSFGVSQKFVQHEDGSYDVNYYHEATRFDTIDEIMKAIYKFSLDNHLSAIHSEMTYKNVRVKI